MSKEVDQFLEICTADVRGMTEEARKLVKRLIPDAVEKVHPGWKVVAYSFTDGMKDAICAVAPLQNRININFFRGSELSDPAGLLEGSGKRSRHVKITDKNILGSKDLADLIATGAAIARLER